MPQKKNAFTLIELLVVVAIIALLISILLPSLSSAREQGKKAVCLANLRGIGLATNQYANEDEAELLLGVQQMQVVDFTPLNGHFGSSIWGWRTVNWFMLGGATAQDDFIATPNLAGRKVGQGPALRHWGAQTRPLNKYMYPNLVEDWENNRYEFNLKSFECPGDRGYPSVIKDGQQVIDDSPESNAYRKCYRTMGNSYRTSLAGYMGLTGHFTYGPFAHKVSELVNTAAVVAVGEPTFFNMIGNDGSDDPELQTIYTLGWHRQLNKDNVLYCDGSARTTTVTANENGLALLPITPQELVDDNFHGESDGSRGDGFQLDTFPTPGAMVWYKTTPASMLPGADEPRVWPFARYSTNLQRIPESRYPWVVND